MAIIELNGISKVFRTKEIETTALENVNLQVEEGEFVSIMGPSGCGKSTLLNIIGLLDNPTTGTVSLLGHNSHGWSDSTLSHFRNDHIGFVFQSFHLIPSLNVAANVELPLTYRSGMSGSERRQRVEEVMERLEMTHRLKHPMPARGHSASHSRKTLDSACRRTDGQSRQQDGIRSDVASPPPQQRGWHDDRYGNPQREPGTRDRPHHPVLRRTYHLLTPTAQ